MKWFNNKLLIRLLATKLM